MGNTLPPSYGSTGCVIILTGAGGGRDMEYDHLK